MLPDIETRVLEMQLTTSKFICVTFTSYTCFWKTLEEGYIFAQRLKHWTGKEQTKLPYVLGCKYGWCCNNCRMEDMDQSFQVALWLTHILPVRYTYLRVIGQHHYEYEVIHGANAKLIIIPQSGVKSMRVLQVIEFRTLKTLWINFILWSCMSASVTLATICCWRSKDHTSILKKRREKKKRHCYSGNIIFFNRAWLHLTTF